MSILSFRRKGMLVLATAGMLALSGCSNDISDLERFVQQERQKPRPPIPPPPEINQHETFESIAANRRSPFQDISQKRPERVRVTGKGKKKGGPRPIAGRPREALEAFPLDSLRMVGVLEQSGVTWALVKDSNGSIHRVKAGNYMGQNHGKIILITETEIKLREIVPTGLGTGEYDERPASISLSE